MTIKTEKVETIILKLVAWIFFSTILFSIVLGLFLFFYEPSILNARTRYGDHNHGNHIFKLPSSLSQDFEVPINDETLIAGPHELRWVTVDFQDGERLKSVLDKLICILGEKITYEVIHGQLCILPVKKNKNDILTPLDVRISVDLGTMSTWEAIKAVVIALNQQKDMLEKPVFAEPEEVEWDKVVTPLLLQPQEFNLEFQNVTAREALCAIFSMSELDINYRYVNYSFNPYQTLEIVSHLDRYISSVKFRHERVDIDEMCWWSHEVDGQIGDWDVVPPYYRRRERWCDDIETGLDMIVSIDVKNVSLWKALEEIVKAVNSQENTPHAIFLFPQKLLRNEQPPSELIDLREISLKIDNITAKEATKTVMDKSSLKTSYSFSIWNTTSYHLLFSADRLNSLAAKPLTPKQLSWWKRKTGYHGIRWIPPGRESQLLETTDEFFAHLGLKISVSLENLSVWEAFKEIVIEVNKQAGHILPLDVCPEELDYKECPLSDLTDLREITVTMQDVTVKEMLDSVLAKSSLDLSYAYEWQGESSRLVIVTQEDGKMKENVGLLTTENETWWEEERGIKDYANDGFSWVWTPLGMNEFFEVTVESSRDKERYEVWVISHLSLTPVSQ